MDEAASTVAISLGVIRYTRMLPAAILTQNYPRKSNELLEEC